MRSLTALVALSLTIAALVVVAGCDPTGYADLVRKDQSGGILALRGDQNLARADAEAKMRDHCGGDYEVTVEEKVVVGEHMTTVDNETRSRRSKSGVEESVTSDISEYRLTYACSAAEEASEAMSKEAEVTPTDGEPTPPAGDAPAPADAAPADAAPADAAPADAVPETP